MTNLHKAAKSNRYKKHNVAKGLCEMCSKLRAEGDDRFCQEHRKKLQEARRLRGKIKRAGGAVL